MAIAFIPLRGGSKSIPFKNIKNFCGKPLSYWVIKALQESGIIEEIIIATDSDGIRKVISDFGFSKVSFYKRSPENSRDTSSTEDVMLEFLSTKNFRNDLEFILVQATNPFLIKNDIEDSFRLFKEEKYDSLLSCVRHKRFFWNKNGKPINYDFKSRPRRQDFEGDLMENGAFYISTVEAIIKSKNRLSGRIGIYEMPEYTAFEIDEADDWLIMEHLFKRYMLADTISVSTIKLFLTDVDGVLTDAGMYYAENGDEMKKFNTHDGMGFQILREHGIKTGIITSEDTKIVERRALKLKVDYLHQGKRDGRKLEVALQICEKENISLSEVAYIGDDINCFELLSAVGLAACPADAVEKIKGIAGILQLETKGGDGVVREFIDYILKSKAAFENL